MSQIIGSSSIRFEKPVYILESASIVGKKEGEGPLGNYFDMVGDNPLFGCNTWEEAESTLQKEAATLALSKADVKPTDIRYIFSGDLLGQLIASSFGLLDFEIPFFGLYGACSTCGESLSLGSMTIAGGYADKVLCVTSSHFASAEKQFRFPLEYGNQHPLSASWTVTGSGAFVLTGEYESKVKAKITGDLGSIGQTLLLDLLKEKGFDISKQHMDCGIEIFDSNTQDSHAGGSGCGCSAVVLSAYILGQIHSETYKRILFIPTGALLSTVSFNEGKSVPGIAHGIVIEKA